MGQVYRMTKDRCVDTDCRRGSRWRRCSSCSTCATLCYMAAVQASVQSSVVGVRELRQNLSVYLVRVQAGEALRVTDRGRVVALLSPLPADATPMDALIAGGRATAGIGNLADSGATLWAPVRMGHSNAAGHAGRGAVLSDYRPAYLESSALLKLIVPEAESRALWDWLSGWPDRFTSTLAHAEILRTLRRKKASAQMFSRAEAVLAAIEAIHVDRPSDDDGGTAEGPDPTHAGRHPSGVCPRDRGLARGAS